MDRCVEIITDNPEVVSLAQLRERDSAVVLLGDPGMGKTYSLKAIAGSDLHGRFFPVRSFLAQAAASSARMDAQTWYLDALDEAMVAGHGDTALDSVARKLNELGQPKFWLSCRPVDWKPSAGRALLEHCVPGGRLAVVRLLPLNDMEVTALAAPQGIDGAELLEAMAKAGLEALLRNPQTLELSLKVAASGDLPGSRYDLYERACLLLAQEANEQRAEADVGTISEAEILIAAGALSASLLIGGQRGVTLPGGTPDGECPAASWFMSLAPPPTLRAAIGTRLFTAIGAASFEPQHRTVAEFLAARFLACRVRKNGFPVERILALVCGEDGLPHPSLRGLFAWLVTHLREQAEVLAGRDPYAVLTYGDPARLPSPALRTLLRGLQELAAHEPFFRKGSWAEPHLGALAVPELTDNLRAIIAMRPTEPHLLACALDALAEGTPLPELVPDLCDFLLDTSLPSNSRAAAVRALMNVAQGDAQPTITLFRRLLGDANRDPGAKIAARLALKLYPAHLAVDDVLQVLESYLHAPTAERDPLHLGYYLPDIVPLADTPELLDRLTAVARPARHPRRFHDRIVGRLACRLLPKALPALTVNDAPRLASWLSLLGGTVSKDDREGVALTAAFLARADLLPALVLAFMEILEREAAGALPDSVLDWLSHDNAWLEWPSDAPDLMLRAALAQPDPLRGRVLYAAALRTLMWSPPAGADIFDRVWAAATDPTWIELRDRMCGAVPWHIWRKREAFQKWRATRAQARHLARTIGWLQEREEGIRAGSDTEALAYLAAVRFALTDDLELNHDLPPPARLRAAVGPQLAGAAEQGFVALVTSADLPGPSDVARWSIDNQHPCVAYAYLAGADVLLEGTSPKLHELAPETLASLVCLALDCHTRTLEGSISRDDERPWVGQIVAAHPAEVSRALRALIAPQLAAGRDHAAGLRELCRSDEFLPVRPTLVHMLLTTVDPAQVHNFRHLAQAAYATCERGQLLQLVKDRLAAPEPALRSRWPLVHLAWRIDPESHEADLRRLVATDPEYVWDLVDAVGHDYRGDQALPLPLSVAQRGTLIEVAGMVFPPASYPVGEFGSRDPYVGAQCVRNQLQELALMADARAGAVLAVLAQHSALSCYRPYALQALAEWRRADRERRFEAPPIRRVVEALRGGAPASSADLAAFVGDHLRSLRAELRASSYQIWRQFWNTDPWGRPTQERPENVCRDQVALLLRSRFEAAGVAQGTEVRHVAETRCDIVATGSGCSLPVEVKRDTHPELWTAWREQLSARYAIEPDADGRGIYLVLWCGDNRRGSLRRPPGDRVVPATAEECEKLLNDLILAEKYGRLEAIVIDVSPP